jgi:glycosyltransferase involved in cell wall biosynthesis
MRIGIDLSLVPGQRAGGGRYSYELARALARIDPVNSYVLYPVFYYIVHPDYPRADLPTGRQMRVAFGSLPPTLVRSLWKLSRAELLKEVLLGRVDVVHSNTFCVPRLRLGRKRLVVTIYDASVVTHPQFHVKENVDHCLRGIRAAIERADAIITISEHARRELVERLNAPAQRIAVTPLAPPPELRRVSDPMVLRRVRQRYELPERFVLFLGMVEPRKNLMRLVDAYAELSPALKRETQLVVAGPTGWLNSALFERIEVLGIASSVRFIGYVDDGDLAALYSLATVFAYPSLYEGFGIPVLEAMMCGIPVLTSEVAALPEVVGDCALLVPPTDTDAMSKALLRLLESDTLRADLAARGLRRAAQFSWDRCARETLAVYESVAG